MFDIGLPEIIIILIGVVILFYGADKLGDIAKGIGRFSGEFKKGKMEVEKEIEEAKNGPKKSSEKENK